MSYKLKFLPSALKEWRKLAPGIKEQFKKLLERLDLFLTIQTYEFIVVINYHTFWRY